MGNAIKKALEDTSVYSKKDQISGVETDHFFQKILIIFTLHEKKITVQKIPILEEKNNL